MYQLVVWRSTPGIWRCGGGRFSHGFDIFQLTNLREKYKKTLYAEIEDSFMKPAVKSYCAKIEEFPMGAREWFLDAGHGRPAYRYFIFSLMAVATFSAPNSSAMERAVSPILLTIAGSAPAFNNSSTCGRNLSDSASIISAVT